MSADTASRAAQVAAWRDQLGLSFSIAVDGGVKPDNAPALIEAGVDVLIVGTALFQAPDHPVALNFPDGAYLKGFVLKKK